MRASLIFLVLVGCTAAEPLRPPEATPIPFGTHFERTRLDSLFEATATFTGVAVDPSTGERLVLQPSRGLYSVPSAQLKFGLETDAIAAATNGVPTRFEDVAVVDSERLVLIAKNDGYVFDRSQRLLNRFCYLPGDVQMQDPDAYQLSRSVGWDPLEEKIYAQPQTYTASNAVVRAELGVFSARSATPLEWQRFSDLSFNAGGMAVDSRKSIWLGIRSTLYEYDAAAGKFSRSFELVSDGIDDIQGLALDRATRTLVVLDGTHRELVDVPLSALK